MFVRSCRLTHLIVDISAEIQRNVSLLELTLVTFFDGLPHLAKILVGFGLVLKVAQRKMNEKRAQ